MAETELVLTPQQAEPQGAGQASGPQAVPPEFSALYDHVVTCSKCGFCQPVCPIFRATGREAHVARGKLALFRNLVEGRSPLVPELKEAYANCLLCRACTEACFSAVKTDKVVVTFRHQYGERFGRGFLQRQVFRRLLPRPRLMRSIVRSLWALRRTGLPDLARRLGLIRLLNPKLERAMELSRGVPGPLLTSRLATRPLPIVSAPLPRVGYWVSCGYNYALPEVGEATVSVLETLGYQVEILDNCCCGLAAYGYGDLEAASHLAQENLRRLEDLDRLEAVVTECGSCSGHLKEYGALLKEDPLWRDRAAALSEKTRSFSEFVMERGGLGALLTFAEESGPPGEETPAPTVVTYHEPCHLGRRYQNIVEQPRAILRSLPGIAFREAAEADSCCGLAGTYGVLHPQTSAAIAQRKMSFFKTTGARVIATECPACMMQLAWGAQQSEAELDVVNVSQLCAQALKSRVSK